MKRTILSAAGVICFFAFTANLQGEETAEGEFPRDLLGDIEQLKEEVEDADLDEEEHPEFDELQPDIPVYIDGQEQNYGGAPFWAGGEIFLPVAAAVQALNEYSDVQEALGVNHPFEDERPYDVLDEEGWVQQVDNRESVALRNVEHFGVQAYWFDDPARLHLETGSLLGFSGVPVGATRASAEDAFNADWKTGYGKAADEIGFHGGMNQFNYTNRFGEERSGDVPDVQIEIKGETVTYLIASDEDYATSKNVAVGDDLFEARRMYGSSYEEFEAVGKTVRVYDVREGSIWFIADDRNEIERIGLWHRHVAPLFTTEN
ncbi:hypothetical protein B0H94_102230 [Salsuginibacillus halophilus]|uniref:Copper amine oxidase-like protein n=1 Tax=Salsuginibacillus halophilus TaxID=517424 RepID=A0A2P8HXJ0_9BACI|nr:hypothetical protein [Salsuginibacillus halophilus]PSL50953.1 hypothetical protein B0H94_102230 [Salsuginibacillus halophilus]